MDALERAKLRAECLTLAVKTETRTGYAAASSILLVAETYFDWVMKAAEPPKKDAAKK